MGSYVCVHWTVVWLFPFLLSYWFIQPWMSAPKVGDNVTARLHVMSPGPGNTSCGYSRLTTSLRYLAIILSVYYPTPLKFTFATVSTDLRSYQARHGRMPLDPSSGIMGRCDEFHPIFYDWQSLRVQMLATTWLLCPKMSVNGASTECQQSVKDSDLASWTLQGQWNAANPQSTYQQPLWEKMLLTIFRLPPTLECPQCIHNFNGGSAANTAMRFITLFLNWVLRCQSCLSVLLYNFTNMHAMSHTSDFLLVALESIFKNLHSALP